MDKNTTEAKTIFDTICSMLNEEEYNYTASDDKKTIYSCFNGDIHSIEVYFFIYENRHLVECEAELPYEISKKNLADIISAITYENSVLSNGCFVYNAKNRKISFRIVESYENSQISTAVFKYMLTMTNVIVDTYSTSFIMINKGLMSFKQFLEKELQEDDDEE